MCGINGFSWGDEELVKRMNDAIRHRGPDDEGVYVDDNVSLGHVRLAIIDLSPKGHQPMKYEKDGKEVWIVYNGEIYNFMEIRKELEEKGYTFTSNTDTEVILAAYLEWGFDCVERFNGMWAFVIYDKSKNILFLSRDRFGIKPLYYYYDGKNIIFSSEIKGILQHNIPRKPNDAVIFDFLYYNLLDHTEDTFFEGIKRLMPGYNAVFDLNTRKFEAWKYYDLRERIEKRKEISDPQGFKDLFLRAVKMRLVADVPVGSCLSGGLDSSSIVCAMRHLLPDGEIKVFSLVFPGKEIDESKYQRIVVDECRVSWYRTTFNVEDVLADIIDLIRTQEEPFSTLSIYGQYRVMKLARENGMKVLLDGQGSDEILAGYHYFFGYYFVELLRKFKWGKLLREILAYKRIHGSLVPLKNMVLYILPVWVTKRLWRRRFPYLREEFIEKFKKRPSKELIWKIKTLNEALLLAETYYSLPHLLRFEDKNAMRWSIESRVPFCDHELVEYVLSLPPESKVSAGITKVLLRKGLKGILPDEIRNRASKVGFATPDKDILKTNEGQKFALAVIDSESFKKRPYWDYRKVLRMFEEHVSGKKNWSQELWKVIIMELWLREWMDNG
ncbi:asparagine synthase (glutamine-hydrolyzing) [Pyrococcus abyssi]|uniref:Putative asparagine synthetase [glutamine-hydrolyzing] n=1 Tax=Pyrococcus abyssi (strain GE5 / Orsay) TaxID=272844 RepID=Q9UZJ0_PYRAB|nr:asparagine synthase (glutamine-hydrolyzing) [Pyrococcus abyssi]CAB50067.1 Putative putative asparagine synthetase (glutamine-hydrolyzing) (EC 6.3.5.4) [Pyrococcus abyssi GE5]CCE70573.1 TPA: putative asparagine synthetase, glutamine-hydrolyzing [Pyrococcus abyssi GE5]